jgi:hypothetical protein
MTADCPVCDKPFTTPGLRLRKRWLVSEKGRVRLGWVEDEVIRALMKRPMSTEKLISKVYASDGGPERARQSVQVVMTRLKPRLRTLGWTIENSGGQRSGAIYALKRLEDEA